MLDDTKVKQQVPRKQEVPTKQQVPTQQVPRVVVNRPKEGSDPNERTYAPGEAPVEVATDSLEAKVGYGSLLRQLQESFLKRVAYFRSKEGGALSWEDARARACDPCENEEQVKELGNELRSMPVSHIRFVDLARMWTLSPGFAEYLWEDIKSKGREEFESGHLAANYMVPLPHLREAWAIASYVGLRESFAAEWKPQGGIELGLIDMLAQSFLQFQHWLGQSVKRSQTPFRRHTAGYIQWQERLNVDPIDDGYSKGNWDMPYVREQVAIEHAAHMADRWNRLYMRTLRNLRDLRRYSVTINNPQQVNIASDGGQQINVSQT
jgi:hypothetical protein